MFQVSVTASGGGGTYSYGQKVTTLEEARVVADTLEWIFIQKEAKYSGFTRRWPSWFDAIDHYEGCDIYATNEETGDMWILGETEWEPFWIDGKCAL